MIKLNEAVNIFLTQMELEQASCSHIEKTGWHLSRLVAVFDDTAVQELTRLDVVRFMRDLRKIDGEPYSEASQAGFVQALKSFFGFARRWGWQEENIADTLKRKSYSTKRDKAVPADHLQRVLDSIELYIGRRNHHPADVRTALIISFSADSGARLGEIHSLLLSKVKRSLQRPLQTADGVVYRVESRGKSGEVILRFYSATADLFQEWMRLRPPATTDKLFVSLKDGQPLIKDTVSRAFDVLCKFAEVPIFRAHAVRHRNITDIMRAGGDPKMAAAYANHADESVTIRVYRHLIENEVDDAMAAMVARRRQSGFAEGMASFFGLVDR